MGRPVIHWELWTNNPDNLSDFYAKAFDWKRPRDGLVEKRPEEIINFNCKVAGPAVPDGLVRHSRTYRKLQGVIR